MFFKIEKVLDRVAIEGGSGQVRLSIPVNLIIFRVFQMQLIINFNLSINLQTKLVQVH